MIRSTLNNNLHRIEHINVFYLIFQQPASNPPARQGVLLEHIRMKQKKVKP
jgi:hypothetical protein